MHTYTYLCICTHMHRWEEIDSPSKRNYPTALWSTKSQGQDDDCFLQTSYSRVYLLPSQRSRNATLIQSSSRTHFISSKEKHANPPETNKTASITQTSASCWGHQEQKGIEWPGQLQRQQQPVNIASPAAAPWWVSASFSAVPRTGRVLPQVTSPRCFALFTFPHSGKPTHMLTQGHIFRMFSFVATLHTR